MDIEGGRIEDRNKRRWSIEQFCLTLIVWSHASVGIKRNPLCFILHIHTQRHTQQGVWTKEFRTEKNRQTGRQAELETQREA